MWDAHIHQGAELVTAMCHELRTLAAREEELAHHDAELTPYWVAYPQSVTEHRAAAKVLRAEALKMEHEAVRERAIPAAVASRHGAVL